MCTERNINQSTFRILDGLLENAGCNCGTEPLSTPIFLQKVRSATAPHLAMPFILRASQWEDPTKISIPATPADRMEVNLGGLELENSQHRPIDDVPAPLVDNRPRLFINHNYL